MDAGILEEVLYHIHNWFERDTISSNVRIEGGSLPASVSSHLLEGQWYRIEGSYLNDGLHKNPDTELSDETFNGTITLLAIPKPLLAVAEEISDWVALNRTAAQQAAASPYQSESFDGYSYSIRSDLTANSGSGGLTGWQAAFASQLNPFRKIS